LLTGSATPSERPTHSGAGRIVSLRVRPLTLTERETATPTVSLMDLLEGRRPPLTGNTTVTIEDYVSEILMGGFPGMRALSPRLQRRMLDGYLDRIFDTDLPEIGLQIRHPGTLRRWLTAYAAATSTTASYERIRDAATSGFGDKPAKTTTIPYREALERLWILEPLEAWMPSRSPLSRLAQSPKHHLTDPCLAARLVGADAASLLAGRGPNTIVRDGTFLGALFESLATLSVRVFAQAAPARVAHLRTRGGEHEIDLIVEGDGGRVLAIEVKLSETVNEKDVSHLRWLSHQIGHDLIDALIITTGAHAYRRADGIGVVPLALLGA
jgi:predicted AAA+ superfamily ATPase